MTFRVEILQPTESTPSIDHPFKLVLYYPSSCPFPPHTHTRGNLWGTINLETYTLSEMLLETPNTTSTGSLPSVPSFSKRSQEHLMTTISHE